MVLPTPETPPGTQTANLPNRIPLVFTLGWAADDVGSLAAQAGLVWRNAGYVVSHHSHNPNHTINLVISTGIVLQVYQIGLLYLIPNKDLCDPKGSGFVRL